jgi:AAA ATPase domain/Adenylate and Guanylate cyclase catalytic domain
MRRCLNCGQDNPGGFRFCGACGSPLVDKPHHPAGEERKVVTVLFCDLVGFTARSDRADPEDVGAMLRPFHARLRGEIERVGGTLDKLIGDAVMAVFGVPAVHEDDPERAVRCALRMLDAIAELNRAHPALELAVRIGVNTGEALVALERSRPGVDLAERPPTPLIGRVEELAALRRSYRRAFAEHAVQLVTVLGEPGVGKSRLVREFAGFVDARPELVAWRRGHCLSYGEAVGFWALGEIIKAQAGILESDDPREVAAKLDTAVRAVAGDASEREWLKARLAPLVGLATVGEAPAGRDESLVAWRRFLHLVAGQSPLILVIEDLHWADPALLDFLEQLVGQASAADLLVVVTARPELLESRPWPATASPTAPS